MSLPAERRHRFSPGLFALLFAACSGTPEGSIRIVTGDETDTFSRAPAPTTLIAERLSADGSRTEITRAALPSETVDLGERPRSEVGAIAVRGEDASGAVLVRGESLFVQWGALASADLEVFVQRTGELARLPRAPQGERADAVALLAGRYVVSIVGRTASLYDMLTLQTLSNAPALPRDARSLAVFGTTALVIDADGAATVDFDDGTTTTLTTPQGGTFGDVAGGARVAAGDAQYIVGGTRVSGPTTRVLAIDDRGVATFAATNVARAGACATFVTGRGLVVVGGSANGAGVEILAAGATVASPLAFPSDPVVGCAAATLDASRVLVVGGSSPTPRVYDLACTASCAATGWADTTALVRAEAHALAPDAALVIGDDADGATRVLRVTPAGAREIAPKIPRRGARSLRTSNGGVLLVGGAPGLEQYLE